MAYLGNRPAESYASFDKQVFTIVNSQTAYTLSHSVTNENDIRLVVNNVVQEPGSGKAYTASGTSLTLSAALVNGTDEMYCVFLGRALQTINPPSGSVGTAQLASTSVTAAKIASGVLPTNTPNFFVQSNGSAQTLGHSSHTKFVNWGTPSIDTASNWDSTNSRYTFDSAGKYLVQASLYFNIAAFDKRLQMSVRKNGSAHILSTVSSGKNNSANVAYMNEYAVSDYLEIFGYQDQSSGSINMGTEAVMTFLSITKIIE